MNPKALVLAVAIACLTVSGALIIGDDDGTDDANRETDGKDEVFEWPSVNDSTMGSVQMKEFEGERITFVAVPENGCRFVHWIGTEGLIVNDNPVTISIVESGAWAAVFDAENA